MRSAETVAESSEDQPGSTAVVTVQQRAGRELNQRSFEIQHQREGRGGHVVDEDRDRARRDRRFARSTTQLTPALFAEEMSRRSYNESTATIEELDPAEAQQGSLGRKPEKVPHSAPGRMRGRSAADGWRPAQHRRRSHHKDLRRRKVIRAAKPPELEAFDMEQICIRAGVLI